MKVISKKISDQLNKADINASEFKRTPLKGINFTLASTIKGDNIKVYANDTIEYDLHTNKRHKQAVLNIEEEARNIDVKVPIPENIYIHHSTIYDDDRSSLNNDLRRALREHNRLLIPNSKISIKIKEDYVNRIIKECKSHVWNDIRPKSNEYEFTIKAPKQVNHLLCGIDETAHFICALPEEAKSVKEAHEMLRPKGIPDNALRQGEWFIFPATSKEIKKIEEYVQETNPYSTLFSFDFSHLEENSSHRASTKIILDNKIYAIGIISDIRKGRHKDLVLSSWHRIVRNREIPVVQNNVKQKSQYWD